MEDKRLLHTPEPLATSIRNNGIVTQALVRIWRLVKSNASPKDIAAARNDLAMHQNIAQTYDKNHKINN